MAIEEVCIRTRVWRTADVKTPNQEFSIEIPDKEADAIHSGMFDPRTYKMYM